MLQRSIPTVLFFVIGFCLLNGCSSTKKIEKSKEIVWMSIEEAEKRNKKKARKIFIDVYTDWCGWCKKLDRTTFSDPGVIRWMNKNFYAVKLNAESKLQHSFNGETFNYRPGGRRGVNEIALYFLGSKLSYPSMVFLDENKRKIQTIPGFIPPERMSKYLEFIGENHYQNTPYELFVKQNLKGK